MTPDPKTMIPDLFSTPDSVISPTLPLEKKSPPRLDRTNKPKTKTIKGQAYLPGLSRRGRPRKQNSIEPTVRAAESRKKRIESGAKRIEMMLAPEVATALDALASHHKETRVEIISRLVIKAAKRILTG